MVWSRLGKTDLLFRCAKPLFWERKQIPWRKEIPSLIGTDWNVLNTTVIKIILFPKHNKMDGVMIKSPYTILKKTQNFRFTNRSFRVWCGLIHLSSLHLGFTANKCHFIVLWKYAMFCDITVTGHLDRTSHNYRTIHNYTVRTNHKYTIQHLDRW